MKDATSKKGKTSGKTSLLMAWWQIYSTPPVPFHRRLVSFYGAETCSTSKGSNATT